jgi:hypothetical protein
MATIAVWFADLPVSPPAAGVEVGYALSSMMEDGDRVVVVGLWQLEVRHGLAHGLLDGSAATSEVIDVETVPRSQAEHPGWLDREAATSPGVFNEAQSLEESASAEENRIWIVWSPALPLEKIFFPAFTGWRRERIAGSPIIAVDLLVPPSATASDVQDSGSG